MLALGLLGAFGPVALLLTSFKFIGGRDVMEMYANHSHLSRVGYFIRLYGDDRSTFSIQHLTDLLQLNLLVAPFSIVLVLAFLRSAHKMGAFQDRFVRFAAILTGCAWTCLLFWISRFPMERDWDPFSLFALPTTVFAFLLVARSGELRRLERRFFQLIALALVHTVAFIWTSHAA